MVLKFTRTLPLFKLRSTTFDNISPKFRAMLRQPGFSVPEEYIWDFAITSKKEDFLDKMFENVKMAKDLKSVDLFKD